MSSTDYKNDGLKLTNIIKKNGNKKVEINAIIFCLWNDPALFKAQTFLFSTKMFSMFQDLKKYENFQIVKNITLLWKTNP